MHARNIAALLLVALFSGWNLAYPATHAAPAKIAAGRLSDAQIDAAIKTKLAKSKIGADGFTAHVKNGTVTWEGKTNVIQHKGAATRMAKSAGATAVVNNIRISEEARRKAAEHLAKSRAGNVPIRHAAVVK